MAAESGFKKILEDLDKMLADATESKKEAEKAFNQADKDKDSRLSLAEFKDMLLGLQNKYTFLEKIPVEEIPEIFADWDKNHDNFVDFAEFLEPMLEMWGKIVDFGKKKLGMGYNDVII